MSEPVAKDSYDPVLFVDNTQKNLTEVRF